ncbi:MAG: hypothetical protein H6707_05580 [Deltaproteobacteria bacterium]|nr:hypothetical protein [Deltaproteobacteria bacterium]
MKRPLNILILTWGVFGVCLLLFQALWRLTPLALEPLRSGSLSTVQALIYALWVLFNAYAEGYRGFQKRFSPKVVARAAYLAANPRPLHVALAPAFCMSYFFASRRAKIVAWSVTLGVIGLVLAVHRLSQPWRGIVDGGVVVGLAWGMAVILWLYLKILFGAKPDAPTDLPSSVDAADFAEPQANSRKRTEPNPA